MPIRLAPINIVTFPPGPVLENGPGEAVGAILNIENLRAFSVRDLGSGTTVNLSGYYAKNDGGGGVFYFDAVSSLDENGGTVIAPASGSGRWIRSFAGFISARYFGATGDGVTDDSEAIQAAIDYCEEAGGGRVEFPAGAYRCNVILKSGVELSGRASIYGFLPGEISAVALRQAAAGAVIDTPVGGITGASITGLNFSGIGGGVAGKGIYFRNATWCAVKSCQFDNFTDEAIRKDAGFACVFEDILTTNVLLNHVRADHTGCVHISGTDDFLNRIEANASLQATGGLTAGIKVHALVVQTSSAFVQNCIGEFSDHGIYVACNYTRFMNCRADHNYGHGFMIASGSNQFFGCLALDNSLSLTATYSGFYVPADVAQNNQFTSCRVISTGATLHKHGFEDYAAYFNPAAISQYVACDAFGAFSISEFKTNDFLGSSVVGRCGSKYENPTGVVTPDVAGTQFLHLDTGAVTEVTDFLNGYNCQVLYVYGSNTVTVKNNANISTNTGADKLLVTGRLYQFVKRGKWIEVGG